MPNFTKERLGQDGVNTTIARLRQSRADWQEALSAFTKEPRAAVLNYFQLTPIQLKSVNQLSDADLSQMIEPVLSAAREEKPFQVRMSMTPIQADTVIEIQDGNLPAPASQTRVRVKCSIEVEF